MKSLLILLITICCFALFSFAYYSFLVYINPEIIPWRQFESNGTLVYSNSGSRLFIAGALKSLVFSIPFSLLFILKLKLKDNKIFRVTVITIILNSLVILIASLFILLAIPCANIYLKHINKLPANTISNPYPHILTDFIHFSLIIGLIISFIIVLFNLMKILKRFHIT